MEIHLNQRSDPEHGFKTMFVTSFVCFKQLANAAVAVHTDSINRKQMSSEYQLSEY